MRTKMTVAAALLLAAAGLTWAVSDAPTPVADAAGCRPAGDCCPDGPCCFPGAACCEKPAAKSCCPTGDCCTPGAACCEPAAASAKAEKGCPLCQKGEELTAK